MFRELINAYPEWLVILIITSCFLLFAVCIVLFLHPFKKQCNIEIFAVSIVSNVMGTLYAVLFGFTIIALRNSNAETTVLVGEEATALAAIVRYAETFDPNQRAIILKSVKQYIDLSIQEEWPDMQAGKENEKTWDAFNHMYSRLLALETQTEIQKMRYAELLTLVNKALHARRLRLGHIDSFMTGGMQILLIAGLGFLIFCLSFLVLNSNLITKVLYFLVVIFLSYVFAFTLLMKYPFSGDHKVVYDPLKLGVLKNLDWHESANIKNMRN